MDTNQMPTIERIRLGDLAARLGCTLRGDPDIEITGVAGVERAGPTELTFLANPKYAPKVKETRAGAMLVKQALARRSPPAWYRRILITISPARWPCSISRRARSRASIRKRPGRHGAHRRRSVRRGVCGGWRARDHRRECGAASACGDL